MNIANWIANLNFEFADYSACEGCKVHAGFYWTYLTLATHVIHDVQTLLNRYATATILVTGHSLGAAMAVHCGLDLVSKVTRGNEVRVYSFGTPRVGNPAFASYAASTFPQKHEYRVTHKADPVPHLPLEAMGYLHAPHELWYNNNANTTWRNCQDSATAEDPLCSDSVPLPIGFEDHLLYLGVCTECSCTSWNNGRGSTEIHYKDPMLRRLAARGRRMFLG